MTKEEKQKAIDALKISAPIMTVTHEEFNDYIHILNQVMDWLGQEPCEDSVSRKAVFEAIDDCNSDGLKGIFCSYDDGEKFKGYIKNLSSVTPQPKTGHWVYENFNWRCSECNETPKTMGYVGTADFMTEHFKFCNHCGAKMINPQESEDKECS